jgi:hypothetical protein
MSPVDKLIETVSDAPSSKWFEWITRLLLLVVVIAGGAYASHVNNQLERLAIEINDLQRWRSAAEANRYTQADAREDSRIAREERSDIRRELLGKVELMDGKLDTVKDVVIRLETMQRHTVPQK